MDCAKCQWLMPVILTSSCNPRSRDQEDHSLKSAEENSLRHKKELVEWLKVKALSSNPSTTKIKAVPSAFW
jgi:hypothetical protein